MRWAGRGRAGGRARRAKPLLRCGGGRDAARSSRRAGRALRTFGSENVLLLAWGVVWGGITTPEAVAWGLLHRWVVWGCAEGRGSGSGLRAHRRVAGAAARPGSAWRGKTMAEGRQGVVSDFGKQWHGAEQPAARLRPRGASGHAMWSCMGGRRRRGMDRRVLTEVDGWMAACPTDVSNAEGAKWLGLGALRGLAGRPAPSAHTNGGW